MYWRETRSVDQQGGLASNYVESFERVWESATVHEDRIRPAVRIDPRLARSDHRRLGPGPE
jgi:hypothetical protein